MKSYSSSYDSFTRYFTLIVSIIIGWAIFMVLRQIYDGDSTRTHYWIGWLSICSLALLWIYALLTSPKSYSINEQNLQVHATLNGIKVPLQDIKLARRFTKEERQTSIRTFGIGGLFGYTGLFANNKEGKMRFFIKHRKELVLVSLKNDKKYVLSPDEPDTFLQDLAAAGVYTPTAKTQSVQ